MAEKLTTQRIKALRRGPRAEILDAHTSGLAVRIGPRSIVYSVRARIGSRNVRKVIGPVDSMSLRDARLAARSIMDAARRGEPTAPAESETRTFKDLAAEYLERWARMRKRTAGADEWMLDRYVLPAFGAKPIENVTRGDVIALLEGIAYGDGKARKPAPIQSNRIRSLVHKVFRWAVKTGRAHGNPAADTEKYGKERARDRVLTDNELWALWAAFEASTSPLAEAFKLMLLTGQRRGEVAGMTWAEIDFDAAAGPMWTLPGERTKNGRSHRVPLAPLAVRILRRIRESQAASEQARSRRQGRDPVADVFVFPNKRDRGAPVASVKTAKDRIAKAAAIAERWTLHDLRRTAASGMVELGAAESIVGRILNHAPAGVTQKHYIRASFDAEKRDALESWALRLMAIAYGIEAVERVEAGS